MTVTTLDDVVKSIEARNADVSPARRELIVRKTLEAMPELLPVDDGIDAEIATELEKAIQSFRSESKAIRANRRTVDALNSHPFVASRWVTRRGVRRCLACGHNEPESGECEGVAKFTVGSIRDALGRFASRGASGGRGARVRTKPSKRIISPNVGRNRKFPAGSTSGQRRNQPLNSTGGGFNSPKSAALDGRGMAQNHKPFSKDADLGGVMICFHPSADAASKIVLDRPGAEPIDRLHMTLAYLGSAADYAPEAIDAIKGMLQEFAADSKPLSGKIGGLTRFYTGDENEALVANVDVPMLAEFREDLIDELDDLGLPPLRNHGFTPHMTLMYLPSEQATPIDRINVVPLYFNTVSLRVGGDQYDYVLGQEEADEPEDDLDAHGHPDGGDANAPDATADDVDQITKMRVPLTEGIFVKSVERRYTFTVVYKAADGFDDPENHDAHKEFATGDELFDARVRYLEGGDRNIYIQHGMLPGVGMKKIGEWVDIVQLPWAEERDFALPGGKTVKRSIPAESVWMGIIWTEEAWPAVQRGEIRGLSFGGKAKRMVAD